MTGSSFSHPSVPGYTSQNLHNLFFTCPPTPLHQKQKRKSCCTSHTGLSIEMIYSHYQGARGEQKSCLDGKHVSLGRNNVVFNESLCPDLPLWCSASTSISTDAQIKVCPRHTLAMLTISAHFGSIGFF